MKTLYKWLGWINYFLAGMNFTIAVSEGTAGIFAMAMINLCIAIYCTIAVEEYKND